MTWLFSLCGVLVGTGAFFVYLGARGRTVNIVRPGIRVRRVRQMASLGGGRFLAAALVGLMAFLFTGCPVGGALAGISAVLTPRFFRGARLWRAAIERRRAVGEWAGTLRDFLASGRGVYQAVADSAPYASAPIRASVERLAESQRGNMERALHVFGDEVRDPQADRVVNLLLLATQGRGGEFSNAFGRVASTAAAQVASMEEVEEARTEQRSSAKGVALVAVVIWVLFVAGNRDFLDRIGTFSGQVALALFGGAFVAFLAYLAHMDRPPRLQRFALPPVDRGARG